MTTVREDNMFAAPGVMSDVILLVEGRQLHVNKTVLSLASPVFRKMLFGEFKEKSLMEIPLPEKKHCEVLEFLLCIYPSTSKTVTESNLDSLLLLADEYAVQSLKERCRTFAISYLKLNGLTMPKTKLVHFMLLADRYGFPDVLEECLNHVIYQEYGDINGLKTLEEFEQLSEQTTVLFLKRRLLLVERLVRSVLVNSFSASGQLIDDFEVVLSNRCSEYTHRHSRHECRECKTVCCARCRKLATQAMEDLTHAIKNMLPAFKESE